MKKTDAQKQSWRHVIANNWYMLKIMMKIAPEVTVVTMLETLVYSVVGFLTETYLLRYIVNGFQEGLDIERIIFWILLLYSAQFLTDLIFCALEDIMIPASRLKMEKYVMELLFEKNRLADLQCYEDKEFFDSYIKAANDFLNRVYDVNQCLNGFVWQIVELCLYSFLLFVIDPVLIIFSIFPVIVTFVMDKRRNKVQHEYDMKRQEEERQRDYTRRTFYLSDFAKEMRLTNICRVMFRRFDTSVKNIIAYIQKYGFRLAVIDYIVNETQEVLSSMGAMLYAVYQTLVTGNMLYGDCLVVINSVESLMYTLRNSVDAAMSWHRNSLYIDTLRTYLEYEPKITDGETDAPERGVLELKNVSFCYAGQESDVLHDVNITIREGEKIALVGHNGAGKSTLVKLMLRLYDPTNGQVTFGGRDVKDYKLDGDTGYRERFSVVFQDFRLFSLSVADNVLLRRRREGDDELIKNALVDSGSYDKVQSFEKGADTILTREFDERGEVLSGGEAQKISIARAFARNSSVVLLDEPSSALDPVAEYRMYETLMKACRDKAVVFISHRLSSAVLADKIYLLDNGRVIEEGSHAELMGKDGEYAKMFRVQAQNYVTEGQEVR